jgi:hypothetical protein
MSHRGRFRKIKRLIIRKSGRRGVVFEDRSRAARRGSLEGEIGRNGKWISKGEKEPCVA